MKEPDAKVLRPLGRSRLAVTGIGVGGSPLGSFPRAYGHPTSADDAIATVDAVLDGPFNFLDTSYGYGEGDSERRIGEAVRRRGGWPTEFVIATKVDGDRRSGRFDRDRVLRCAEQSLVRLRREELPLLYLHDPEFFMSYDEAVLPGGPIEGLIELREKGIARNIGIAGGAVHEMARYVESGVFDVLLTHSRLTIVDRSATTLIAVARRQGMGVVNAAVLGGGALTDEGAGRRYAYGLGHPAQDEAAARMGRIAADYGVPLAAVALQYSIRHADIDATLVGASRPARVAQLQELAETDIPPELWVEIEAIVPDPSTWLEHRDRGVFK